MVLVLVMVRGLIISRELRLLAPVNIFHPAMVSIVPYIM